MIQTVGDRAGEAATLSNIGAVYSALGEQAQALEYFEQALPLRRAVGDKYGEAATLNNMGIVLWGRGEPEKGLALVEQAQGLFEYVRSPNAQVVAGIAAQMRQALQGANSLEPSILPPEQIEALVNNTLAVKTVAPESRLKWYTELQAVREQWAVQGADWEIEVAFVESLLAVLDDQPAILPEANPYRPYLEALLAALDKNRS